MAELFCFLILFPIGQVYIPKTYQNLYNFWNTMIPTTIFSALDSIFIREEIETAFTNLTWLFELLFSFFIYFLYLYGYMWIKEYDWLFSENLLKCPS